MPFIDRPSFVRGIRWFDPGHFQNFVGVRLGFAPGVDDRLGQSSSDVADLANTDPLADTGNDFNDAQSNVDQLTGSLNPDDFDRLNDWVDGLGGELDDQSRQPLPGGDPTDTGAVTDGANDGDNVRRSVQGVGDRIGSVRRQLRL